MTLGQAGDAHWHYASLLSPFAHPTGTPRLEVLNTVNTTWTSGRNLLYAHASSHVHGLVHRVVAERPKPRRQGGRYLYYIGYDQDVGPTCISTCGAQALSPASAVKPPRILPVATESDAAYFNRLLRREMPALAGLDLCCDGGGLTGDWGFELDPMVHGVDQCVTDQDAMLSAHHRDAAAMLYPYSDKFENRSWWTSAHIQNLVILHLYPGAQLKYAQLRVLNEEHEPYPRAGPKHGDPMVGLVSYVCLGILSCCAGVILYRNAMLCTLQLMLCRN